MNLTALLAGLNLTALSTLNMTSLPAMHSTQLSEMNITSLVDGVNLTSIGEGMNLTSLIDGMNLTSLPEINSTELSETDLASLVDGLNLISLADAVNLTSLIDETKLISSSNGINLTSILDGLNLTTLSTLNLTSLLDPLLETNPTLHTALNTTLTYIATHPADVTFIILSIAFPPTTWLRVFGFGARGVRAGSIAAAIHRTIGNVAAGSPFAIGQSVGARGRTGNLLIDVPLAVIVPVVGMLASEGGVERVKGLIDQTGDGVNALIRQAADEKAAKGLLGGFKGLVGQAGKEIPGLMAQAGDGVNGLVAKAGEGLKGPVAQAGDWFNGLFAEAKNEESS
ncbi:hypothetical protein EJ06DRAFT_531191 [Trichodelitschia bisporula]|uniref:Uncharacterized protein n=1 Tax=Trichodelitschia bisporula TaxID=703511 RepID=A0A6G1HUH1_9PEZI|nr:hypothetical protein EJ06DRAFT_531191 [Trichodelitschia bisporula]